MFLSPIFYPITALPKEYRFVMQINPLTFVVEQSRDVMIWGHGVDWKSLMVWMAFSLTTTLCGYFWFQKTRKGFADVL